MSVLTIELKDFGKEEAGEAPLQRGEVFLYNGRVTVFLYQDRTTLNKKYVCVDLTFGTIMNFSDEAFTSHPIDAVLTWGTGLRQRNCSSSRPT